MKNSRTTGIFICTAVLTALLIPCIGLFREGNWLYYVIRDPEMHRAWGETAFYAALLAAAGLRIRSKKRYFVFAVLLLLVSAALHSMLLPLLFAVLWFALLMLTGRVETGAALVILTAAGLSLFQLCTPAGLLIGTLPVFTAVFTCRRKKIAESLRRTGKRLSGNEKLSASEAGIFGLILLIMLVQTARANLCIDHDSLWYGVRSAYILVPGGSIFEDLGLAGMVYTYPKGFEILTLPFSVLPSYAVISAFNLCLFALGLSESFRIGAFLNGRNGSRRAVILTALVPGIVNMTLSAKPDMMTWLLQLLMIRCFFEAVREEQYRSSVKNGRKNRRGSARYTGWVRIVSVYLVSLTMKPTAVIFSTALFGMMAVWLSVSRIRAARGSSAETDLTGKKEEKTAPVRETVPGEAVKTGTDTSSAAKRRRAVREWAGAACSAAALAVIWGRTVKLTGLPFTSVFTGILEKLGFRLKYPFSSRALPSTWQEGSQLAVALKRLWRMLLMPAGKDMSHVLIAWGGSMFFVLFLILAAAGYEKLKNRRSGKKGAEENTVPQSIQPRAPLHGGPVSGKDFPEKNSMPERTAPPSGNSLRDPALTVFLPYLITCFITLMMLYQVDGNYYMTAYSVIIFLVCPVLPGAKAEPSGEKRIPAFMGKEEKKGRGAAPGSLSGVLMAALAVFQFAVMTMTSWAGTAGFFPVQANRGYYDHQAYYKEQLSPEDGSLYSILTKDPETRAVSFGEHPQCLQFPCVVQSYNDITSPWGNVELVNSTDAFLEYLHFAKIDYVYADAAHLAKEEWSWSKGLLEELAARGELCDFVYEGENRIARVKK